NVIQKTRAAIDAQRLVHPRHEEEQPDAARRDDVLERVEAIVARRVRDEQCCVVRHLDKTGLAAARRSVAASVLAGAREDDEGRELDEATAMLVEAVELLLYGALLRGRIERAQCGEGIDHARIIGARAASPMAFA